MIRSPAIRSQHDQLVSFIEKCANDHSLDVFMLGHLGRYSCVSAAGFVENSLGEVFVDFIKQGSRKQVANFAIDTLRKIQNPKSYRIVEVAGRFHESLGSELAIFLDADNKKRRDSIDSIMNNRHLIAHGKTSSITLSRVKAHLADVHDVIVFIEKAIYR